MNWLKMGQLYTVANINDWAVSHCHKPTSLLMANDRVRIYFGVRDDKARTRTTFVDARLNGDGSLVISYVHDRPVLDLGKIGAFDDSGANVCSVVRSDGRIFMYFIGWNPSTTVHTRNSIGLAVSEDEGLTFRRLYDGPVLDRNKEEPYYTGAVDVIKGDNGLWQMWYTSGSTWKILNGKPEIKYHIKYAWSENGVDWIRKNQDCILPEHELEAVARPCVVVDKGCYKMWYSKRLIDGFRINPANGYRGGYAESQDGLTWTRMDGNFGMELSNSGWDSEAIAYPYVIKELWGKHNVMLYNGNGFGRTGFGYAVAEQ